MFGSVGSEWGLIRGCCKNFIFLMSMNRYSLFPYRYMESSDCIFWHFEGSWTGTAFARTGTWTVFLQISARFLDTINRPLMLFFNSKTPTQTLKSPLYLLSSISHPNPWIWTSNTTKSSRSMVNLSNINRVSSFSPLEVRFMVFGSQSRFSLSPLN